MVAMLDAFLFWLDALPIKLEQTTSPIKKTPHKLANNLWGVLQNNG
jgi:hypothetical protein